jgi:DNA-binding NtrC family response regulator/tetratricopeptide (TPR) repeat protein
MNPPAQFLGESAQVAQLREQINRLLARHVEGARRHAPILIRGETGTGKGLLANVIHRAGPRAGGPFVDVNCAAIPDTLLEAELFGFERGAFTDARQPKLGLFQAAHGGTLFLDEVGLLGEGLQAKLLKALEERTVRRLGSTRSEAVDVWLVAATSENLEAAMRARSFREDLYHRLAVVTLHVPPLRERAEDILPLGEHFLGRACEDYGLAPKTLSADARAALQTHAWPGNVRELANVMERVALLSEGSTVTAAMLGLPCSLGRTEPAGGVAEERRLARKAEAETERTRLLEALRATKWNISQAAVRLGVPRNTLRYRMDKHGLSPETSSTRRPIVRADIVPLGTADESARASQEPAPIRIRWETRRVTLLRGRLVSASVEPGSSEFSRAMEIILDKLRSFRGQIHELSPTAILATFGLEPVEDAPRRAAHAAMTVERAITRARTEDPSRPEVKLAIHTAELLVARVNGVVEMDADPVRAVLDTLANSTDVGTVVVTSSSATFLRRWFDLTAHGAVPGVAESVHRLGNALEPVRRLTPFVGRHEELDLMVERLERARTGRGQMILLVGEPGVGKTRLLEELRSRITDTATWLEGHSASFGRTAAFHPLVDLLRRTLRVDEGDSEAAVAERIEEHVLQWSADLRPVVPFVRALLGIDPGDPGVESMESNMRRARTFEALRLLFLRVAEIRSLVLVCEDVHWADQATEDFLALMADSIPTARILLILTFRPGYTPPFTERSYHTRLGLETLSTAESIELARRLLTSGDLPPELQTLVLSKAEGNPFFLEEIIRSLQEVGALRRGDGGVVVDRPLDDLLVPATIEDVILARIGHLEDARRRVLQVASVIGKNVPFAILKAVADLPDDSLRLELTRLQTAEFLYEVRRLPELEYTFKHALTHDVAYGRVDPAWRRMLHARTSETIERLHLDRLDEHVESLAYHAYRGELWDKAVTYTRRAGLNALARSANREAAASFEDALRAIRMLQPTQDRRTLTVDLLLDLRTALRPLGEYERIFEYLRDAEALAESMQDQGRLARVATDMTHFFWVTGQQDRAIDWGHRALALAVTLGDVTVEALANHRLGRVYHALGDYRHSVDFSRRSFTILPKRTSDASGSPSASGTPSRHWLVWSLAELGEFREALVVAQEAVRAAEADGRPVTLMGAYLGSGYLSLIKGDLSDAISALDRALTLCRTWQFPAWFPPVASALALAYTESGRVDEALPLAEAAVTRGESMRLLVGQSYWIALLGEACAHGGRVYEAERLLERALALCRERRERGYETWALRILGEIVLLSPNAEKAAVPFRQARAFAEELGMRPLQAHCHLGLGKLYRRTDMRELAREHLAIATRMYREMGMTYWLEKAEAETANLGR